MTLRYPQVFLLTVILIVLHFTACHQQEPSSALEDAALAGNWEEVEIIAETSVRSTEFLGEASILRGYAALARGDTAAAVRHFLRARSGRHNRTETRWREALATRYPDSAVVQLLAGDALARRGDQLASLARLDAALALDPNLAVARIARGMLRAMVGERTAALQDLDTLATGGPAAAEALVARGFVQLVGPVLQTKPRCGEESDDLF